MTTWADRCREEGCTEGIYGDRYCQAHYWDNRHAVLLEAMEGTQPTHPDLLPVKPLRVEWGKTGWAAYMPLPEPRNDHLCRDHPDDFFAGGDGVVYAVPEPGAVCRVRHRSLS